MKNTSIQYNQNFDLVKILLAIALAALLAISFAGCSAKWHIKRAIKKDPTILQADTVTVRDTVFIAEIRHDTAFLMRDSIDTFIVEKERLHVKILRFRDTLKVAAKCEADTVVRVVKVPYKKIIYKRTLLDRIRSPVIWLLVFLALLFLFRLLNPLK